MSQRSASSTSAKFRASDAIIASILLVVLSIVASHGLHWLLLEVLPIDPSFARAVAILGVIAVVGPVLVWVTRTHTKAIKEFERIERVRDALVTQGGDLLVYMDNNGTPLWASDSFTERLGWTPEDLRGGDWSAVVHPDDFEGCCSVRTACIREHRGASMTYRARRKDGGIVWVEASIFALVDHEGRPDGFVLRNRDVSGVVALRGEVERQAERASMVQRAAGTGVAEYDVATGQLTLSGPLRELLGLQPDLDVDVALVRSWIDGSDDGEVLAQIEALEGLVAQVLVSRGEVTATVRLRPPDGRPRDLAIVASAFRDGSGRAVRLDGMCRDRTEQVRQMEALADAETTISAFIEHAPVAMVMCDREFRCVRASRQWDLILPGDGRPAPGRPLRELLPGRWERWEAACQSAMSGLSRRHNEDRVTCADGRELWLRWEIRAWSSVEGGPSGVMVLVEDIGERKHAEREARRARELLDSSEEAARIGGWSYDVATGSVSWSREVYRLFDRDESLAPPDYASVLALYEPASASRLDAAVRRAVTDGLAYEVVLQLRSAENGVRYVSAKGRPIRGEDGQTVVGLTGTVRDVTAEVEREEELRRAREDAERGNRAKTEFLASMSHEIRTPMTAILGYAELLSTDAELQRDPARIRAAAETVRNNARHLLALINDILDLSKIEAGKLVLEHLPTNVNGVIAEVLGLLGPGARTKGLHLAAAGNVTDGSAKAEPILTDPIRLRQILVNLIGNAIKFTERGSVLIEADLVRRTSVHLEGTRREASTPAAGAELLVRVVDTGIGMSPSQMERVFGSFEQGDASTSRRFGGSGLGLRISRRLAELLGGQLTVASTVGEGSTFTLRLPVGVLPPRGDVAEGGRAGTMPAAGTTPS